MTSGKKLTIEDFIVRARIIHGEYYDYTKTIYHNMREKVIIICKQHGQFWQTPCDHLKGNGCKNCNPSKYYKKSNAQFISEAQIIHNNKYDYSLVEYTNNKGKIKIICPIHGIFKQEAKSHLLGHGCIKCMGNKLSNLYASNTQIFINRANKIHNFKYDYSLVNYTRSNKKVIIICPINNHGKFSQVAFDHLDGSGCMRCRNEKLSITKRKSHENFIKDITTIHQNKYDYSLVNYIEMDEKITIICPTHGPFLQIAHVHAKGSGCPKCTNIHSKPEIEWLNHLNIPEQYRKITLKINLKLIKPDAYDPTTNTIYEFYGDYWHGNPNKYNLNDINRSTKTTYGELYTKTLQKEQLIKNSGYKLITIWESDWKIIKKQYNQNPIHSGL